MDTTNKTMTPHEDCEHDQGCDNDQDCEELSTQNDGALALEAKPMTREQRRSRRKRDVRAKTISVKRMTKRELEIGRLLFPETDYWKPRTRADCANAPRPCPYISCKHHLFIDVSPRTGAIKLNFPDLEVWEMNESCALDIADRDGDANGRYAALVVPVDACDGCAADIELSPAP